jgi:hypothetical protein
MLEMLDPIGNSREDRRCDQRRQIAVHQMTGEHQHAESRQDDASQQADVVDRDWLRARPEKRRRQRALKQRGVGARERAGVRVEDVGVEQPRGIGAEGVRNPREPPGAEQPVVVLCHPRGEVDALRPGQVTGEGDQDRNRDPYAPQQHQRRTASPPARRGDGRLAVAPPRYAVWKSS